LDRKGQGDLAYEQLDIETGDDNELSRARAEFYEQYYLQENNPAMMKGLIRAKKLNKAFPKPPSNEMAKTIQGAKNLKDRIEVEVIPDLLSKTPTPVKEETSQQLYMSLLDQKNRPLTVPEVNKINNILTQRNAKKIPYGTLAHNGAEKLKQAYMKKEKEDMDDEVEQKYQKKEEQSAGGGVFFRVKTIGRKTKTIKLFC
jgi:hypothetical protein